MSTHSSSTSSAEPLDLSKWRSLPNWLILLGGLGAAIGFFTGHDEHRQFGFSWLEAFMFFLSLCLGGMGMVMLHHLFDASWSIPIRRVCEHLAWLLPVMAVLFIPIAALAPKIYPWMQMLEAHTPDHAVIAKHPLFTFPGFYISAVLCFAVWIFLAWGLRKWSLKQDQTGEAVCTVMMRRYSAFGIFLFAFTVTLAAIMWMKALQAEWFSTMYGVWYFAGLMWTTLFTLYFITVLLKRQGPLREVATEKTFYFIGSLMFAFTVFYGYVTFFQYFIIWNANMPEETFWYVWRERGTWWDVGMIIIFGHFFLPFLLLLRIDVKVSMLWIMLPLGIWAWLMHFVDMSFQVMLIQHPDNFAPHWLDFACFAFIGGVLLKVFLKYLNSHPVFPQKDPRIAEAMDIYVPPRSSAAGAGTGGGH